MTDIEINELSIEVITSIAEDLRVAYYDKVGGTHTIEWGVEQSINAYADSNSNPESSPNHKIIINYELLRAIYRDIETYCYYIENNVDSEVFENLCGKDMQPKDLLTNYFSKESYHRNIFLASITWVFFHELGHLKQEHGYVRSMFNKLGVTLISECSINNEKTLEGKAAAVSHITEIAADFEAINICNLELIKHFKGKDMLLPAIFLFTSGVSLAIYAFYNKKILMESNIPQGTHPNPLVRLEIMLPQIWEFFSIPQLEEVLKVKLSRKDLVYTCQSAASSVGIFWMKKNQLPLDTDSLNNLTQGMYQRPELITYMKILIETWDEIIPIINLNRSKREIITNDFGLLYFTDESRSLYDANMNK